MLEKIKINQRIQSPKPYIEGNKVSWCKRLDLHTKASANKTYVNNQRPLLLTHIYRPGLGLKNYSGDRKLRQSTHKVEATVIILRVPKKENPERTGRVGSREQRTRSFRHPLQSYWVYINYSLLWVAIWQWAHTRKYLKQQWELQVVLNRIIWTYQPGPRHRL